RSPRRIDSALERCSLMDRRKSLITTLSKGYRQRVGIAQAIVHDPPVIILDEPTVGLDPRQIIEVRELIKGLAGQHTIILSTHILPEVSMTCDRVTIINQGKLVTTNSPESLINDLSQGSGYRIEVAGELAEAEAALGRLPMVQSVTVMAKPGLAPGHVSLAIQTEGETDPGRALAAALVEAGLGLYEMQRTRASMEEVFLKLTMQETAAEPGESGEAEPVESLGSAIAADLPEVSAADDSTGQPETGQPDSTEPAAIATPEGAE
ncbi:MAG: ABC transporter ATP-binding protein, partial [Synechococcales cyanobacterium RM1_1_8]|nr:ABC transporter ATP-binding protein [Synechococcales cyanobacterium RM1_1_8]